MRNRRTLQAGLAHLQDDYMGEHWLATFALLAVGGELRHHRLSCSWSDGSVLRLCGRLSISSSVRGHAVQRLSDGMRV